MDRHLTIFGLFVLAGITLAKTRNPFREPEDRQTYDGYQVLRVTPTSKDEVLFLRNLMFTNNKLDFWEEPSKPGKSTLVMVPPEMIARIQHELGEEHIHSKIYLTNLREDIDREFNRLSTKKNKAYDKTDFNTYEEILSELNRLARDACPAEFTCEVDKVGETLYESDLVVFRIRQPGVDKRAYWLDSAIHAREWLAPATNMYILDELLTGYGTNRRSTELLDGYDWHFMPIVNPDGYRYTWTEDRLWRKNLTPFDDWGCDGVDLNRNFDASYWGEEGVSDWPCMDTFCGPSAGSEIETQTVQKEFDRLGEGGYLIGLVTMHSFGEMFMHPWGHTSDGFTCVRAEDHQDMFDVANATATAIAETYNTEWWYGTSCEVIYATTGSTTDYAKEKSGVKYSYVPELRGPFFIVEPDQIEPSATEMFNGLYAMVNAIAQREGF